MCTYCLDDKKLENDPSYLNCETVTSAAESFEKSAYIFARLNVKIT